MTDASPRDVLHRLEDVREEVRALDDLLVDPLTLADTRAELTETVTVYALLEERG